MSSLRRDSCRAAGRGQQEPHHAGHAADLLGGSAQPERRTGDHSLEHLQAVLVSNNPTARVGCWTSDGGPAGQGTLGVIAARLASTGRAVGLLRRAQYRSVTRCTAPAR